MVPINPICAEIWFNTLIHNRRWRHTGDKFLITMTLHSSLLIPRYAGHKFNLPWLRLCSYYSGWPFVPTGKATELVTELVQVVHTYRTLCRSSFPWGFGSRNPNPHTWIFDFRGSGFSPFCLLIQFYFGPNTCSYCTKVWYRTYPIYATLHSRDLHGAASVCFRNCSDVTRSPSYPMLFSCRRKKYPV